MVLRRTKRARHGEWVKGVDVAMGNKNLTRFLSNGVAEEQWDEWGENVMLDIDNVVTDIIEALDIYKDSAKFGRRRDDSFYSDDSASWDSSGNEDDGPKIDEEEKVRSRRYFDNSTSSDFEGDVVKVSDKSECSDPEQSANWDSFADDPSSEVFTPSVVEEVNIFEGSLDDFNDCNVPINSPEIVKLSFFSYHSSSWDSSWDSSCGATGDGIGNSHDLD